MKSIALLGITTYQRYVSPHKGWCCAYRAATGRQSCSVLGYRAIRRHGIRVGIALLRERFVRCAEAMQTSRMSALHRQKGFCDADCDLPCDGSIVDCAGGALDAFSCCDGFDDCGPWRRKRSPHDPQKVDATPSAL